MCPLSAIFGEEYHSSEQSDKNKGIMKRHTARYIVRLAWLLAVLLLGVFRAGYIPSGFIYTQF